MYIVKRKLLCGHARENMLNIVIDSRMVPLFSFVSEVCYTRSNKYIKPCHFLCLVSLIQESAHTLTTYGSVPFPFMGKLLCCCMPVPCLFMQRSVHQH